MALGLVEVVDPGLQALTCQACPSGVAMRCGEFYRRTCVFLPRLCNTYLPTDSYGCSASISSLLARPTAHMPPSPSFVFCLLSFVQQTTSAPYYGARVESVGLAQRPSLIIHRTVADKEKRQNHLQVMGKPRNKYQTLPHTSTSLCICRETPNRPRGGSRIVLAIHGSTMPER